MVDLRLWIRHPNTGYLQNRRDPACLRQAGGVPVALAGAVGTVGVPVVAHVAVVRWCRGGGCAAHRCGNRCTGEPCTATAKRLLRTETEMRAANPEPASALWPRHIVAHGGWDMRSRACRAPDSTCDPRGSTQTGAQRAARPPIAAHPGEADHITHTRGYTRDAPFRAQGSAAGVADCQSAPRHNYPVNQSTTATLPSITTPGKRTAMSRPSRHHERRTARSHL